MKLAPFVLACFAVLGRCGDALADARECPAIPSDVTWPLSEEALELHCRVAGTPCSASPGQPELAVAACGGLSCRALPDDASGATVCSLPRTRNDCSAPPATGDAAAPAHQTYADPQRVGGTCSVKRCTLIEREGSITDAPGGPDAPPPDAPPPRRYQPSVHTVFEVCGGLGCVDDPTDDDATVGYCALATEADHCGGLADPQRYDGRCGPRHLRVKTPEPIRPARYLATGGYVIDVGNGARGSDVVPGGIFQVAFSRSQVRQLEDGSYLHFGLPSFYAHGALLVSRRRLAPELGVVYKTGAEFFTRVGAAAFAQLWSPDDILSSSRVGAGPSVHVELFYNLLVRGAYLFGEENSPEATFGIQYAASLFDDFK